MVDNKPVLEQIHELQVIVNKIHPLKIILPEPFQVGAIIAKLPPSWKDYGKKLLHKSEDFTLEQIQKHLRIEEESRLRDHFPVQSESKVLNLEASGSHSKNKALQVKNDGQKFKKQNNYKKYPKKKGACHVCGKFEHYAKECRFRKSANDTTNMVEENLVAMISKINMTTELSGWWLDSGATVHVCKDKGMFKTFKVNNDGQEVQMGNNARAKVSGKGTIEIDFTSGKRLTLLNVFYVPEI
ncbi:uncharacterized protein LOC143875649 [Tasmannia lanceolata]|uniref:uncharacterized protein LOC143875649 n=1 Tax=Tasmannia lanceolata TaxID=3420 RepID=UPI004063952C